MRVAIVGGGVMGSAIAFNLASRADFRGSVTVIEREPTYHRASSALSASSIREQFTTPVNIAMSQYGLQFLQSAGDTLEVDGQAPELSLRLPGYLFLATEAGLPALRGNHAVHAAHGADVALLSREMLNQRFPWLSTEGIAAGSLGLSREGSFDGPALLAGFRRKARALGVTYLAQDAVGFARTGELADGVILADGAVVGCDVAVNAAGPWSSRVAGFLGIDLPVRARKRMVYVLSCQASLTGCALVIDPSGVWFRREGQHFLAGRSPVGLEADPDEPPLTVEDAMFDDIIWPVIAARVPAFGTLKVSSSWAGYYEFNLFDQNGVVGPHPAAPNVLHAAGFSGHGMQHAAAVGRGVAELIVDGGYRTLDLSPLAFTRLLQDRPLVEQSVV